MSFKETGHFRRKVALFEDGQKDWIPRIESGWVAEHYAADVKELCDHIKLLEEVVGAAKALILARNRLGVLSLYTNEFERLHAALRALQTEERSLNHCDG